MMELFGVYFCIFVSLYGSLQLVFFAFVACQCFFFGGSICVLRYFDISISFFVFFQYFFSRKVGVCFLNWYFITSMNNRFRVNANAPSSPLRIISTSYSSPPSLHPLEKTCSPPPYSHIVSPLLHPLPPVQKPNSHSLPSYRIRVPSSFSYSTPKIAEAFAPTPSLLPSNKEQSDHPEDA